LNILQFSAGPNGTRNTASTLLSPRHYWTFDEVDDARWDYIGDAHAMPYNATIPVVSTALGDGIRPNDGTSVSAKGLYLGGSRSFTIGVWAQTTGNNDDHIVAGGGFNIKINFSSSTQFRFVVGGSITNLNLAYGASADVAQKVYWLAWDADTLTARYAINDSAWSSTTLSGALDVTTELFFGTAANRNNGETTIAEAVVWDRFLPSQAERADMYANWTGPEYFDNVGSAPASPFSSVTLVDMTWLSDADLVTAEEDPGTYFLRPYPLHSWDPVLAASKGDYLWLRSTDHAGGATDGLFIGYSNSPATPPSTWTKFLDASDASTASGSTQGQLETPDLTYDPTDPDDQPFRISAQVVDSTLTQHITGTIGSQAIYQTTILYKSADLDTWEWHDALLPNTPYVPVSAAEMYNHTGYMVKMPWGDGTWRAYSLLSDFWGDSYTITNALLEGGGRGSVTHSTGRAVKEGWWSSSDGLEWTLLRADAPGMQGFFRMSGQRYAVATANLNDLRSARVYRLKNNGDLVYPGWPIENWLLSENGDVWTQGMQIFCEGSTAHIYIKHGYQEPNGVIAYYTATLAGTLDT